MTVENAVQIVGFSVLQGVRNSRNVPYLCLTLEKMPCRVPYNVPCAGCPAAWPDSTARRNCCGGSGCGFWVRLIVSAGGIPAQKRVQGVLVCWGMGFRCAVDRLQPVLPCLICRRAWAQLPARTVCRLRALLLGVVQAGKDSIPFFPAGSCCRCS